MLNKLVIYTTINMMDMDWASWATSQTQPDPLPAKSFKEVLDI